VNTSEKGEGNLALFYFVHISVIVPWRVSFVKLKKMLTLATFQRRQMMKVFQVGPDELGFSIKDEQEFDWVVYYYEQGDYDGNGEAVALKNGVLYVQNLGHCSCYGPMDDGLEGGDQMTLEQFWNVKEDIHQHDMMEEIKEKVIELLK
jgi:hypothetical protein